MLPAAGTVSSDSDSGQVEEENVNSAFRKTFVLGAGFSVAAGFPVVRSLRSAVINFIRSQPDAPKFLPAREGNGLFWKGMKDVDPSGCLEFEELLIALRKSQPTSDYEHAPGLTLKVLKYACARMFWEEHDLLGEIPRPYINFVRSVWQGSAIAVVSFNWDVLFECACEAVGIPWSYSLVPGGISIIKPHGSLNWSSHEKHQAKPNAVHFGPKGIIGVTGVGG